MTPHNSQASLFDRGDAEVVIEQPTSDAKCDFCAILRGEEKVTLIHESNRLMSFLDHRPLFYLDFRTFRDRLVEVGRLFWWAGPGVPIDARVGQCVGATRRRSRE